MPFRIGVDIGGTFTDFIKYDEYSGTITIGKVPTTPDHPDVGCLQAVHHEAPDLRDCLYFLHGTTVGLNALLERRGAVVGLLCTSGFRDVLELRRGSRPEQAALDWVPQPPIVPRHLRLPVVERTSAQGEVLTSVDEHSVRRALETFLSEGVTAIAVCLINAYANPANEIEVGRILTAQGFDGAVSLSHRLSRVYRDYERTSTTVIDAFVRDRMSDYLQRIETGLQEKGFAGSPLIMRSGGGSMSFDEASRRSFETIMSGPVAAAEGAAELSRTFALGDLVTADVGGTSFDTCLVENGRPHIMHQGEVAGQPIQASWVDVRSIGSGGGSVAFVDSAGMLHVGPRSSGAVPGPACYGRGGTEPTTTDAAFLLGMLGEGALASGLKLDLAASTRSLHSLAARLCLTDRDVAAGIIRIASAAMANAIREITLEQGIDPRSLSLLAIGGAGPMLATQIARELDIERIIIPPHAGNFSAWGMLGADIVQETARTLRMPLDGDAVEKLGRLSMELVFELASQRKDTPTNVSYEITIQLDIRFLGQEHSLTMNVASGHPPIFKSASAIGSAFKHEYQRKYGILPQSAIEITALRTRARLALPLRKVDESRDSSRDVARDEQTKRCTVYSFASEADVSGTTYVRSSLIGIERTHGPAVIYEPTTTTYVDTDWSFGVDSDRLLVLQREPCNAEM